MGEQDEIDGRPFDIPRHYILERMKNMAKKTDTEKKIEELEKELKQCRETQSKVATAQTIRDNMLNPPTPYILRVSLYSPKAGKSIADLDFRPMSVEAQQITANLIDYIIRSKDHEEETLKKLRDILKEKESVCPETLQDEDICAILSEMINAGPTTIDDVRRRLNIFTQMSTADFSDWLKNHYSVAIIQEKNGDYYVVPSYMTWQMSSGHYVITRIEEEEK